MAVIFKEPKWKTALQTLVHTVEERGGLVLNCDGDLVPAIDEGWGDLAEVYIQGCDALRRHPMIQDMVPDCPDDEDED